MLDRLARRYHTDPASVLEWSPFRVGLALEAMAVADQITGMSIMRQQGGVQPVVVLNQ